jgi:histidine triad protein
LNNKKKYVIIKIEVSYVMETCIFCKIIKNEIPSSKVYENDDILAFKDINPQAPVHIIVIPKKHIENILELNDESLLTKIHKAIKEIVREQNLDKQGFRLVTNTGEHACQTVKHLHFHILGGDKLPESL